MLPRPPAVVEDGLVGAAGILQGIGQDRHPVEGTVVVNGLGNLGDRAVVPGEPGRVEGDGMKWVAHDLPEQAGYANPPSVPCISQDVETQSFPPCKACMIPTGC